MSSKHPRRHNLGWVFGTTAALLASPAFGQTDSFDEIYDLGEDGDAPVGLFDVADGDADDGAVNMDSFGKVDLAVKDLEIAKVLQLLSIQSQKNIVTSRNVSGSVSADLYGVSFHEALDAILAPNGFGYEEKGNFIYVYTADELQERRDAARETVTRIIRLNYLDGVSATQVAEAMISDVGSVTFSSETTAGFMPSDTDAGANSFALPDTIIVRDYEENVAAIEGLITELDVRPKQVLIEATILQASLTESNAFGVDFSAFNNLDVFDFGSPLGVIDELFDGSGPAGDGGGIVSPVGNTSAPGGVKLGYVGSDAAVFVRALDQVTDTTVVAKPNILVLNRQKADLLVGQRLGYLSTTVTDTSNTQTVEFLDVGTQLTVRPFVSNEGTVRLELRPAISDGSVIEQAGFVIPNEITQELITNIIVEDGQTVVIGGLFKEDTTNSRDQVPIAGDIPLLGAAFQGRDDSVERSEVIFLIKTTIMEPSALTLGGEAAQEAIRNKRIGAKEGLLPWSTDKLVSSNLLTARKALEDGDNKKALWHTNLALHISPMAADALQLKQEITGEEIRYQDRSQLKGIMDSMIDAGVEEVAPAAQASEDTAVEEEILEVEASLGDADTSIQAAADDQEIVDAEASATTDAVVEAELETFGEDLIDGDAEQPVAGIEAETLVEAGAEVPATAEAVVEAEYETFGEDPIDGGAEQPVAGIEAETFVEADPEAAPADEAFVEAEANTFSEAEAKAEIAVDAIVAEQIIEPTVTEEPAVDEVAEVVTDETFEFDFEATEEAAPQIEATPVPEATAEVELLSDATQTETTEEFTFEWAEEEIETSVDEFAGEGLIETADSPADETIADDEWAFEFPETENVEATTAEADPAETFDPVALDESFFEPTGADVPDFATELTQAAEEADVEAAPVNEADQDPVFNYYEQLMSEVETAP
ncbi:MAG: hypothetical protein AAGE65_11795 [Planctomycetota bacterium]